MRRVHGDDADNTGIAVLFLVIVGELCIIITGERFHMPVGTIVAGGFAFAWFCALAALVIQGEK